MKKKLNKIRKIICITLALIILLTSPLGSYIQGENAKAYALEATLEQAILKYALPVAAYMSHTYESVLKGDNPNTPTISQLNQTINTFDKYKLQLIASIPLSAKAIIAKLYTNMTTDDINTTLGTTYTEEELSQMSGPYQTKINNMTSFTYEDIFGLGISHIFANQIKIKSNYELHENSFIIPMRDYYFNNQSPYSNGPLFTFEKKMCNELVLKNFGNVYFESNYVFRNGKILSKNFFYLNDLNLYLEIYCYTFFSNSTAFEGDQYDLINNFNNSVISNSDFNLIYTDSTYERPYIKIYQKINNVWNLAHNYSPTTSNTNINITLKQLIDIIKSTTSVDLTNNPNYVDTINITDILNPTFADTYYEFKGKYINSSYFSSNPIFINIPSVGAGFFSDTTESNAERLINAGTGSTNYDLEINTETKVNDDPDTNISNPVITDIIVKDKAPGSTVEDVTTAPQTVPEQETPDTGGTINDGLLNIPILGTLLAWLIKIWEMLKSIFDSITNFFTNTGSVAEEGVDWGNFKGFFDIFYIFYYLIIIVILILLKFLVVVFNMLNIPPNTSLFDAYPTMLQGINYLKNLKVGGFNITIQQIFEYMFTVFFFLFIVTVLQKLYHSFTGVERQQERETRNIRIDSNDSKQYTNFTGQSNNINKSENITFKDYTK